MSRAAAGETGIAAFDMPAKAWGRGLVGAAAGPGCWLAVALLMAACGVGEDDSPRAAHAWSTVIGVQLLLGVGRASWESVCVAAVAEWVATSEESLATGMACRAMLNAVGGMLGFFILPRLSTTVAITCFGVLAVYAGGSFLAAQRMHRNR